MKTYRVKICFGLEHELFTIFFNVNSRWKYIGDHNGYMRLHRDNISVDVTREQVRKYMVEIKEQKGE